ncbi:MAG: hypothetical protein ACFB01_04795 [Cohaesibacteraceae bacterium]
MAATLATTFALGAAVPTHAQSISNRHHLDACATQSAPVIIPHANVRTVQIDLPTEVDGYDVIAAARSEETYEERFSSRTRSVGPRVVRPGQQRPRIRPARSTTVTRGETTASFEAGSVVLAPRSDHPCHR